MDLDQSRRHGITVPIRVPTVLRQAFVADAVPVVQSMEFPVGPGVSPDP